MATTLPIHILSGFLGSGKTTLLQKAVDACKQAGLKPAVIINEIGEANVDGMLIASEVPTAELLDGCICCTIRGDLAEAIRKLHMESCPDILFIECTGVANPLEMIEGVTDASLLLEASLQSVITVIDAPHLMELSIGKQGKTFRLMREQIRCANRLILNKSDKVTAGELHGLESLIRDWNPHAELTATAYCDVDLGFLENTAGYEETGRKRQQMHEEGSGHHACHDHPHDHDRSHDQAHHHSHEHIMAYTHYFDRPVDSERFEQFVVRLPKEVYRAKGILRFKDSEGLYLFQYAYREMQLIKITPKASLSNVAVLIGENFHKETVKAALERLSFRKEE